MASHKFPMDWHQECFANVTAYVEGLRRDVARRAAELELSERELAGYAEQIAEAKRRGLDAFDRDRFLVKRLKANS